MKLLNLYLVALLCTLLWTTTFATTTEKTESIVAATTTTTTTPSPSTSATNTTKEVATTPSSLVATPNIQPHAASPTPPVAPPANLFRIIVSLILVVGVLIALAVAFKKFGLQQFQSAFPIKIISAMTIGANQRIMVVEAGEEWLVLGVTPHQISTLTSMPRQEISNNNTGTGMNKSGKPVFSARLQSAMENYFAKKR